MKSRKDKWPSCEADVAKLVLDGLGADGWDCYPEAQCSAYGARADIAAVKQGRLLVVETKTALSNAVIEQAIGWTREAHWVYAATPPPRRFGLGRVRELALRHYGVGLYFIRPGGFGSRWFEEVMPARLNRKSHDAAKRLISKLHPDMKNYQPGGTALDGYSTPWRRTMNSVKNYIEAHPGCTIKEILAHVDHHYQRDSTARSCLPGYLLMESEKGVRGEKIDGIWRFFPE